MYNYGHNKETVVHGLLMMRLENKEKDVRFTQIKNENGIISYEIDYYTHPILQTILGKKIKVYEQINYFHTEKTIEIFTQSSIPKIGNLTPAFNTYALIKEKDNGMCDIDARLQANFNQFMPKFMLSKVEEILGKRFIELRKKEETYM